MSSKTKTVTPKQFLFMTRETQPSTPPDQILVGAGRQKYTANQNHWMQVWDQVNHWLQYFSIINIKYDPMNQRNLLGVADFIPCHPNNSRNIQIGDRHKRDTKHYLTNYGNSNSFIHESNRLLSNHPGINALRNKWIKSRLDRWHRYIMAWFLTEHVFIFIPIYY